MLMKVYEITTFYSLFLLLLVVMCSNIIKYNIALCEVGSDDSFVIEPNVTCFYDKQLVCECP